MKNFIRVLLCLSLSVFAIARAVSPTNTNSPTAQKQVREEKADVKTLLQNAKETVAAIIKNARADKDLDPKTPRNKPFWKTVQLVSKSLKVAEAGFNAKSNDFFNGITSARAAEAQLRVDWQLTDSKNRKVIENGKRLGNALAMLRTNFSKEAERNKKSGELTAKEKAQFEKVKVQQKELLTIIKKLESKAKQDKALETGLAELGKQAEAIVKKPTTLEAYIATLYLLDVQAGLIRGYQSYVDKDWRKDYLALVDYTKTYETWYLEWQTSLSYDWRVVTSAVEIQDGEDVDVADDISDQEVTAEHAYARNQSFEMTDAEEDQVAADENNNEEVASSEDYRVEVVSDDESEETSVDESNDSPSDEAEDDGGGD